MRIRAITSPARSPVPDDALQTGARLVEVGRVARQPAQAGVAVSGDPGERLVDLVGNRGGQLAHGHHTRDVSQFRLYVVQRIFGPLALDELPYLAADGRHHGEQVLVGLPDLAAKTLDDPQDVAAEQDRKAEGRVQPFACGDGRALKIRITDDIGNVGGLTAEPHPTQQAHPGCESALAAGCLKFRDFYGCFMPNLDTAQHTRLPVELPQHAQIPCQVLAYSL